MTRRGLLLLASVLAAACVDRSPEPAGIPATADRPAETRLVTLAPHLAELVYAAGAGDALVGVSAYSDYPPAVRDVPTVSDAFTVDLEQLALLRPTIILGWESGTPRHVIDELRDLGYRVETVRTRGLDVAAAIEQIGRLASTAGIAGDTARRYRDALDELRRQYANRASISVFYQVSARPLFTVSDGHFIDEVLTLCGGTNVFAGLSELAPAVTVEAVISRNPEAVLAGAAGADPFEVWDRWPSLRFNRYGNRFTLPPDEIAGSNLFARGIFRPRGITGCISEGGKSLAWSKGKRETAQSVRYPG